MPRFEQIELHHETGNLSERKASTPYGMGRTSKRVVAGILALAGLASLVKFGGEYVGSAQKYLPGILAEVGHETITPKGWEWVPTESQSPSEPGEYDYYMGEACGVDSSGKLVIYSDNNIVYRTDSGFGPECDDRQRIYISADEARAIGE